MYYLADAAIILLIGLALIVASWAASSAKHTLLENTVIGTGCLLGTAASVIALSGLADHLVLGIFAVIFLPLVAIIVPRRESVLQIKENAQWARRGVLRLRGLELILFLHLVFVCALTLVLSLAPPNGVDYDSLVYHLAAPQRYLLVGRIIELPYDHHSYFPFLTEMLFAFGLYWRGAVFAKLFHWLMLPLCCMTLVAIGQRHFSLRAGLLAAALFASLPVVVSEATTGYVDLSLTAWVLLAFLCFGNWLEQCESGARETSWLIWSGIFCGFALGSKYLGALFFGWLFIWAIGRTILDAKLNLKFSIKPLIYFGLLTVSIGGGWYLRNWVWTGNPVFPFAYEIFGGKGWTLPMAKAYTVSQLEYGFGRGLLDWLWLPWRLAMAPLNARHPFWPFSQIEMAAGTSGTTGLFEVNVLDMVVSSFVGPMLLALGAPLLLMRRKPILVGLILWGVAFFGLFWGLTGQYLRYLLPTFGLLCVACGWGASEYLKRGAILKYSAGLCLALWCLMTPILLVNNARISWAVILGVEKPEEYLSRTFSAYPTCDWASKNTPTNAVFAVYGEPRGFYLKRKYFFADQLHNTLIDHENHHSADDWVRALRDQGATHLLWNRAPERNGGVGGAPPFINGAIEQGKLRQLFENRAYHVYEIVPESKATP